MITELPIDPWNVADDSGQGVQYDVFPLFFRS